MKIKKNSKKTVYKSALKYANNTKTITPEKKLIVFFTKLFKSITKSDVIEYENIRTKYFKSINILSHIAEKYYKKPIKDLTDAEIQYTLVKKNRILGYEIVKYIHYRDSKNKIPLERITVDKIRKHYWDTQNNKWFPIHMHSTYKSDNPNTPLGPYIMDDEDYLDFTFLYEVKRYVNPTNITNPDKIFDTYFIPNGNLLETHINNRNNPINEILHKDWLNSKQNINNLPTMKERQKELDDSKGKDIKKNRKEANKIIRIKYKLEGIDENGQHRHYCITNDPFPNCLYNCNFVDIYYWILKQDEQTNTYNAPNVKIKVKRIAKRNTKRSVKNSVKSSKYIYIYR